MKKKNHSNEKIEAITFKTLIVGVDIAKHNQWARFVDCRGIEHNKALKFENNRNGFNTILTRIYEICKNEDFNKIIVGMEPTGHYWKAFANFLLKQAKITVVLVNPYHTKKAKELDDNSQTKSDKKDALTIARLVKDGRYFETYLPHDVYAELRGLTTSRHSMNKRKKSIVNTITAVLDEYFPEFISVFKHPFKGKASMHLLKVCPILKFILELGEEGVLEEIKKAVKKTVGRKKAAQLVAAAQDSIDGMGVVSLATCLGELGNPLRFEDTRQMSRFAGYNLIEDSSGKNKSGTCISKRGRKNLRSVLYQISLTMVATNQEMRKLYDYLKTRENNPLKKMQALVVVSKKVLTLIFTLSKKKVYYEGERVFGSYRKSQLQAA